MGDHAAMVTVAVTFILRAFSKVAVCPGSFDNPFSLVYVICFIIIYYSKRIAQQKTYYPESKLKL